MTGKFGNRTKIVGKVNLKVLVSALGIDNIKVIDPINLKETQQAIKDELATEGPSVIIAEKPCALFKRAGQINKPPLRVDPDKCEGCKACLDLNCPPISWKKGVTKGGSKRKGISLIDESLCNGCGLCEQVCKFGAIS